MRVRYSLPLVLIIMLFLVASEATAAAPLPPELVVNHESKQCAEFWGGDECLVCSLPEGWESLGAVWEAECLADYATVEIKPTCWAAKITFCCSEGHSGAPEDREDVVINKGADKAFGYIDAPIQRVCAQSVPPPFAREMKDFTMVDEHKIADRVRKLVQGEL